MGAKQRDDRYPVPSRDARDRLRSLGEQIPPPDPALLDARARERAHEAARRLRWPVAIVVLASLVLAQWFRPIGQPTFQSSLPARLAIEGSLEPLPWPAHGVSALAVLGGASLGGSGGSSSAPMAGLADVLAAYVVLKDHPLRAGQEGPMLRVSSDVVAADRTGRANQVAEVPVRLGERLSERQALEGLLVAGGNDMATLLADWDAGGTTAFVARMNATARSLGLRSTRAVDPSGLEVASVSSPDDLIRLGEAAMGLPGFASMVALPEVNLPLVGTVYNLDANLGEEGFVGIKTGNNAAGGCFLFEDRQVVDGRPLVLVGAVLGQDTATPTTSALAAARELVARAIALAKPALLVRTGSPAGSLRVPWGGTVPVTFANSARVVAWAGLSVPYSIRVATLPSMMPAGGRVGVLRVTIGAQRVVLALRASRGYRGPSILWRLTRL